MSSAAHVSVQRLLAMAWPCGHARARSRAAPARQVLKKRLSERKDDTERCVLLLRKLGEPDATLQDRCGRRRGPWAAWAGLGTWAGGREQPPRGGASW